MNVPDVRSFGEADAVDAFLGGSSGRDLGDRILAKLATSNVTDMALVRAAIGDPPTPDPMKTLADLDPTTSLFHKIESLIGAVPADTAATDVAGGVAGAGIMSSETAYNAILPYAAKDFIGADLEVTEGTTAAEADAGPVGLVAAFVTTMVQVGVMEGRKVVASVQLPQTLADELAAAKAAPDPSASELAASEAGRTELFTVFTGGFATAAP